MKITEHNEINDLDLSGEAADSRVRQRRLLGRILAAANVIAMEGRRGPANCVEIRDVSMLGEYATFCKPDDVKEDVVFTEDAEKKLSKHEVELLTSVFFEKNTTKKNMRFTFAGMEVFENPMLTDGFVEVRRQVEGEEEITLTLNIKR